MIPASAGVYAIVHIPSGNEYVGSGKNLRSRRVSHLRNLKKGKHTSIHLQRAWDEFGSEAFQFRVLLLCEPSDCLFYEQRYLDLRPCIFNVYRSVGGWGANEEDQIRIAGIISSKKTQWWATKSREERFAVVAPSLEVLREKRKDPNEWAAWIEAVKAGRDAWWNSLTPEEKSRESNRHAEWWAALSPEEKSAVSERMRAITAKRWAEENSKLRKSHLEGLQKYLASLSPEERQAKADAISTKKLKYWAQFSVEERRVKTAKAMAAAHLRGGGLKLHKLDCTCSPCGNRRRRINLVEALLMVS